MTHISDVISNMQQPGGEPSERERHNAIVNALLKGRYGVSYDPDNPPKLDDAVWGRLHSEARWWCGKFEDAEFPAPSDATPEKIIRFFQWYRRQFPGASLPRNREKVLDNWTAFVLAEHADKRNPSMAAPTLDPELAPKHYGEGPRAATMTQADIDAYYAQIAESKTEAREALRKVKGDYRRAE